MTPHLVLIAHHAPWLMNFRGPLLRELRQRGVRVTVLAPGDHPDVASALREIGVEYRPYPLKRAGLNPLQDAKTAIKLGKELRQLRPTHILTTAIKPNIYGSIAAWAARDARSFALVTGLGYAFTGKSMRQRTISLVACILYKLAFLRVACVIFQNRDDQALFIRRGLVPKGRTGVISGSGVDLAHYLPSPLGERPPTRFLTVARITKEKGIRELIFAAEELRKRKIDAEVVVVGPIDENPGAFGDSDMDRLRHSPMIRYVGALDDVRAELRSCHAFVLPSYREGTPRSVLEALATGRPVITTDAPGCRDTVEDGQNGLIVPVGDGAALADAMERVARSSDLQLREWGKTSLALATKRYDVNIVNGDLLSLMGL